MALAGDLSEFALTDIIQLLHLSKKTGGVFLQGKRGLETMEGWLYFRDGKIVGAQLGDLPPVEAVYTFFTFSSGPFTFHDNAASDGPPIRQSNEQLIMQGFALQEEWEARQAQLPPPHMIPRLVTNPTSSGNELNIEAEAWRVLTMINGKNTVAQIGQRSGLGSQRTSEIIARLLGSGLIQRRENALADVLYPELDRIITQALGSSARGLLEEAYAQAGMHNRAAATQEQVMAAVQAFEASATRMFGLQRVQQAATDARAHVRDVFGAAP